MSGTRKGAGMGSYTLTTLFEMRKPMPRMTFHQAGPRTRSPDKARMDAGEKACCSCIYDWVSSSNVIEGERKAAGVIRNGKNHSDYTDSDLGAWKNSSKWKSQ